MDINNVLVTGSLSANPNDRFLIRTEVNSVQLVQSGEVKVLDSFNSFGDLGVSSFAWSDDHLNQIYFSSGNDLNCLNTENGKISSVEINQLVDVHEMTVFDGCLWIANTGTDEIIAYNLTSCEVVKRIRLSVFNKNVKIDNDLSDNTVEAVDKFHCNQVFKGANEDVYALVHHVDGKQFLKRVSQKILKSQGDGGVVNISTGERFNLRLKAPHSVRVVGDNYWVCDSGNCRIRIFNKKWEEQKMFSTAGWGRGADFDLKENFIAVGMSKIRKRYQSALKVENTFNGVQIFSLDDAASIARYELENIEQVNNVYIVPDHVANALLNFNKK